MLRATGNGVGVGPPGVAHGSETVGVGGTGVAEGADGVAVGVVWRPGSAVACGQHPLRMPVATLPLRRTTIPRRPILPITPITIYAPPGRARARASARTGTESMPTRRTKAVRAWRLTRTTI